MSDDGLLARMTKTRVTLPVTVVAVLAATVLLSAGGLLLWAIDLIRESIPDPAPRYVSYASDDNPGGSKSLYLDLAKRSLLDLIYEDDPVARERANTGRGHPTRALTMVGVERLDNVHFCVEDAIARDVPGDLIEAGAWRGGTTILMRAILEAHGITDRNVWVADSFEGLPTLDAEVFPDDAGYEESGGFLAVSLENVKRSFERYGLLDDQVRFLKGWFKDTLPGAPIDRLAVLRIDADMYQSTMEALEYLYPKLSPGGYVIIDDYGSEPSARKAMEDYREEHGITEEIKKIDWTGVYWMKN